MNTILMNTISLDDGKVIVKKGGSSGGGAEINNQYKYVEIVENGTTYVSADEGYTGLSEVEISVNVPTSGGGGETPSRVWTGHADAEGLRAIGWTEEDIAYYQENGVNWNEEDDQYHLVSDDNKALYGVLTADNISTYKDRIVYLPKIDTSAKTNMDYMFDSCYSLVAIPKLDTQNVTNMSNMFYACYSLVSIPQLDTSTVTNMDNMFQYCTALVAIPQLDTQNVKSVSSMFSDCHSLVGIHQLNTQMVTDMTMMFYNCYSLVSIPLLDTQKVRYMTMTLSNCYSLSTANLKNVTKAYQLNSSSLLSKESLLYIINNEAATSAITIKLASYAYNKWSVDADVIAALEAHPNISISA